MTLQHSSAADVSIASTTRTHRGIRDYASRRIGSLLARRTLAVFGVRA